MGVLDNFKNPFGDTLQRILESKNELFKNLPDVLDYSQVLKNPFVDFGEEDKFSDPDNIVIKNRKDITIIVDAGHDATPRRDSQGKELLETPSDSGSLAIVGYKHKIKGSDG